MPQGALLSGFRPGKGQTRTPLYFVDLTLGSLPAWISPSGGANSTVFNSSGVIVSATTPRFDYDPITLSANGLLDEEARTNIKIQSNNFGTIWSFQTNTTKTSAQGTGPDGTTSLWSLTRTVGTAAGYFMRTAPIEVSDATLYSFSIFAKKREFSWLYIKAVSGFTGYAYFNLDSGVVGTVSGVTAKILPVGGGIYRCTITLTTTAVNVNIDVGETTQDNNATASAGSAGDGLYVYGAELELGAFATSYIPTVASSVVRSADVLTLTGAALTAANAGPSILEYQDMQTGLISRATFAAGAFAFQANAWNRWLSIYSP